MALLDEVREDESQVAGAKKKSNSEYQKRAREKTKTSGKLVKEFVEGLNVEVPEDVQEAINYLAKDGVRASGFGGTPVIYKIFGNEPQIGDSVTALEIFEKTGKGFADMRKQIRKWNEAGIKVDFDAETKSFTIVDGDIPAYNE